ncbi:hypothetical protein NC653_035214 [Populus alba x Populus x berolinensis]|uniref:Uncharacterized protein n=1 Tax=Populus alba x Populus x berolinensis TaxID=444605 RepID=A0AAD6LPJ8_9ROSI|nr:hypothetical protein NC653_035214 [Populus alba x Populus x berolinensis]
MRCWPLEFEMDHHWLEAKALISPPDKARTGFWISTTRAEQRQAEDDDYFNFCHVFQFSTSAFVLKLWDKVAKIHAETLPDLFIMNKATSSCLNLEDRSETLAKGTFSPQITNV